MLLEFLDTLIITSFIFVLLHIVKRNRLQYVFTGLLSLVILYLITERFSLQITGLFFNTIIPYLWIIIIFLFRKEIRKFIESFSVNRLFHRFSHTISERNIEALVDAVDELSAARTGATIILIGKYSISEYIVNKRPIEAQISKELLLSLFDKKHPSHDGAITIRDDKIKSFKVFLTLEEPGSDIKQGTRHASAYELSKKTDCLVIIVSEESGLVHIAYHGHLRAVETFELRELIEEFSNRKAGRSRLDPRNNVEEIVFLLLSFLIAVFLKVRLGQ